MHISNYIPFYPNWWLSFPVWKNTSYIILYIYTHTDTSPEVLVKIERVLVDTFGANHIPITKIKHCKLRSQDQECPRLEPWIVQQNMGLKWILIGFYWVSWFILQPAAFPPDPKQGLCKAGCCKRFVCLKSGVCKSWVVKAGWCKRWFE